MKDGREAMNQLINDIANLRDFAYWVAKEIIDFDDEIMDIEAFFELACRKLYRMGIVKINDNGDCWELSEGDEHDRRRTENPSDD